MLLDGFSNVAIGVFNGFPIAKATRQRGTTGQVPLVFGFFLNHNLERIEFHKPSSPKAQSIVGLSFFLHPHDTTLSVNCGKESVSVEAKHAFL